MFRRLGDFRVFKTLKLSQNAIYNRLSIPTVRRFTATSIGFVEPTRSIIHHRIQDYSTWTRTTTTEEEKYTLEQFVLRRIDANRIYGIHYSKDDLCVMLRILSDVLEELDSYHHNNFTHGNISTQTIFVYYAHGRWRGTISYPESMGTKVSDMCDIGRTCEFVYKYIKMLPNNSKKGKMMEFSKFIQDLKNSKSRLTAHQATQHPTFWDFRMKMLFFRDFVENVCLNSFDAREMSKDPIRYYTQLQMTERILDVYEEAWYDIIGKDEVACMKGVKQNDLKQLMIWLRNVDAHRTSGELKKKLPHGTHEELAKFILEIYPNLLIE